jgi:hypothetical protein
LKHSLKSILESAAVMGTKMDIMRQTRASHFFTFFNKFAQHFKCKATNHHRKSWITSLLKKGKVIL